MSIVNFFSHRCTEDTECNSSWQRAKIEEIFSISRSSVDGVCSSVSVEYLNATATNTTGAVDAGNRCIDRSLCDGVLYILGNSSFMGINGTVTMDCSASNSVDS